jgi:hypothetical protein
MTTKEKQKMCSFIKFWNCSNSVIYRDYQMTFIIAYPLSALGYDISTRESVRDIRDTSVNCHLRINCGYTRKAYDDLKIIVNAKIASSYRPYSTK